MSVEDHRADLFAQLTAYLENNPGEAAMVQRYLDFVAGHVDCFERSLLIGHVTGSAMVLDSTGTRVLLTHHRKLERWLQPGGHADGIANVLEVAMKEADEETGLEAIAPVSRELLDVDIHAIPARGDEPAHYHYDCRFLLQSTGSDAFTVSEESHDLAWVPMDQILDYTDEESILRMIDKIPGRLAAAG
jgi:8-oxo-dGTP pyrophosphatase MutT (NUDIX family)